MTTTHDRLATWARRSLDVMLIVLILACLLTAILARVVPLTGRSTFVVAGGSMTPAISVGSAVVVEPVVAEALSVGDVVSLRSGPQGAIFTHRITRVAQQDGAIWIETRGDANAAADPSLSPATAVIGRVTVALPAVGYAIALLSTPSGIIFVISLGLVLFFAGGMLEPRTSTRRTTSAGAPPLDDVAGGLIDIA